MNTIFEEELNILGHALRSFKVEDLQLLVTDCKNALKTGHKIIVTGLGKNVPLCEKFVGTMNSLGMDAAFLHTNSAVHGDMGIIKPSDVIIILTKSGETSESIHLYNLLKDRGAIIWLLTFSSDSTLGKAIDKKLVLELEHEGDPWNLVPNYSSVLNLIVLQKLCMILCNDMKIPLAQFKLNHPGGHIGEILKCQTV